jgi:type IV pilus assembly protein PilC
MIYPAIVMSVAVAVVSIIMVFVIPVFGKLFTQVNVPLPLPTLVVIGMSNFLSGIGGAIILFSAVLTVLFVRQYRKTESGRKITDQIILKISLIGDLLKKVAIARFARTLGTLIASGVPILEGLMICAKTSGNKVIEEAILTARREVTAGKTLAEPLSQSRVFPPMVVQMIGVGETTGALDQMLTKIADFYDDEVDNSVTNLTTALEPILMVFLGVVIGFIVIALYMPIFKIGQVVVR